MATYKLYYDDPFLNVCEAKVIAVDEQKGIVLDQTIAFPEGGGQEGDRGTLFVNGETIEFGDTQKGYGRVIYIDNFPTIHVNTPIYHKVDPQFLGKFRVGDTVSVRIDVERRARLSASHTATHLMLMAVEKVFGEYENRVYGCHIKEHGGRLDFRTTEKFVSEMMAKAQTVCDDLISRALPIKTYPHLEEPEAWYWECDGVIYPCGGTHLTNTQYIKSIQLKKKGLGKNGQRVAFEMEFDDIFMEFYHG